VVSLLLGDEDDGGVVLAVAPRLLQDLIQARALVVQAGQAFVLTVAKGVDEPTSQGDSQIELLPITLCVRDRGHVL